MTPPLKTKNFSVFCLHFEKDACSLHQLGFHFLSLRGLRHAALPAAHEAVDAARKQGRVFDGVTRRQSRHVVDQAAKRVGFGGCRVELNHCLQLGDNGVRRVHLQSGLVHVAHAHGVYVLPRRHGLGLHVALHGGRHAVRALHQRGGAVGEPGADRHFGYRFGAELALQPVAHLLEVLGRLFGLGLVFLRRDRIQQVAEVLFRRVHQRLAVEAVNGLNHELIQRLCEENDLVVDGFEFLQHRTPRRRRLGVPRHVKDLGLVGLHPLHVLGQGHVVLARFGGPKAHQFGEVVLHVAVLDDPHLEVFPEVGPKLHVLCLALPFDVLEHVDRLAHEPLVDHRQHFRLLQDLPAYVQRQVLRVNHSAHKREPPRHELLELVVDEHSLHVELHGLRGLRKHVARELKRNHTGHVEKRFELHLPLQAEVHVRLGFVVGLERGLVKLRVLRRIDIFGPSQPNRLLAVHPLPPRHGLRHRGHFRLLPLQRRRCGRVNFLNVLGLVRPELNGEGDEAGVAAEHVPKLELVGVLVAVLLEVERDGGAAATLNPFASLVSDGGDGEARARLRLPLETSARLRRLGDHRHAVCHQIPRVEAHSELPNQAQVVGAAASVGAFERLHELFGARLRDAAQVVHQLFLGHAHAAVFDGESVQLLIRAHLHLKPPTQVVVGQRQEPPLVARVGCVGHQLPKKHVLVLVQRVDDDVHHPRHFGLKLKRFHFGRRCRGCLLRDNLRRRRGCLFFGSGREERRALRCAAPWPKPPG
mmetsp:Transcript_50878/g.100704  ORF Transcript_50878/g.100704 Transcript_50878/m.100704 type:complete len:756 (+) Transcript_50878:135-2402(+)